jgi:3-deoxy-D-manno-octulosonic-acid transferase
MATLIGYLLNVAYAALLVLLSPVIVWQAVRSGKYRAGYGDKLLGLAPESPRDGRPCVWLHAVSVGEVNLLATTLAELRKRLPEWRLVISTTTSTGYALAVKKYGADHSVFYCPLDFTWAVRRAMQRVRPDLLVLAELELWPNLIAAAKRAGAKVAIINGRLGEKSYRGYGRGKWLVGPVLQQVDLVAAQDDATLGRFLDLGAKPQAAVVTGSLKYDGAETNRDNPRTTALRTLAQFEPNHVVWLAGSTQAPEEQIAIDIFQRLAPEFSQIRLVLVPRHAERFDEVASQLAACGLAWRRRSELPSENSPHVILVDTIGELGAWWGAAQIGFVGGSFGDRGGQNMIEPAAYGVATCFGPNTWNFRDIVSVLLSAQGAEVVEDAPALEAFVRRALTDPAYATELGARAQALVRTQLGATRRTVDLLEQLLGNAQQGAAQPQVDELAA